MADELAELRAENARLRKQIEHALPSLPQLHHRVPLTNEHLAAIKLRWGFGPEKYQNDADALIAEVLRLRSRRAVSEIVAWLRAESRIADGRHHLASQACREAADTIALRWGGETAAESRDETGEDADAVLDGRDSEPRSRREPTHATRARSPVQDSVGAPAPQARPPLTAEAIDAALERGKAGAAELHEQLKGLAPTAETMARVLRSPGPAQARTHLPDCALIRRERDGEPVVMVPRCDCGADSPAQAREAEPTVIDGCFGNVEPLRRFTRDEVKKLLEEATAGDASRATADARYRLVQAGPTLAKMLLEYMEKDE